MHKGTNCTHISKHYKRRLLLEHHTDMMVTWRIIEILNMIKLKFSRNAAVKKMHVFNFLPVFIMSDMGCINALKSDMTNKKE